MKNLPFEQIALKLSEQDSKYQAGAYLFLKDALDFTVEKAEKDREGREQHVSGPELLKGFRDHALAEFGPFAYYMMQEWGLHRCEDIGEMVFKLIEIGVFGKQDSDQKSDFSSIYTFEEAFLSPFQHSEDKTRAPKKVSDSQA